MNKNFITALSFLMIAVSTVQVKAEGTESAAVVTSNPTTTTATVTVPTSSVVTPPADVKVTTDTGAATTAATGAAAAEAGIVASTYKKVKDAIEQHPKVAIATASVATVAVVVAVLWKSCKNFRNAVKSAVGLPEESDETVRFCI